MASTRIAAKQPETKVADILTELASVPMFERLAPEDVERLLVDARLRHFAEGAVLFRQGDSAEGFFIVLAGHVEQFVELGEGRVSVVDVVKPGELFAETAVFDRGVHPVSARTLDRSTLLMVPTDSFLAQLDKRFDLVLLMLSSMSLRLRTLVQQITDLKLKTTAQRVGGFILGLCRADAGAAMVRFPYDKKAVARKLGMKPESLSRALAKLKRVGVSSEADNVVAIADVARLKSFCLEEAPGDD